MHLCNGLVLSAVWIELLAPPWETMLKEFILVFTHLCGRLEHAFSCLHQSWRINVAKAWGSGSIHLIPTSFSLVHLSQVCLMWLVACPLAHLVQLSLPCPLWRYSTKDSTHHFGLSTDTAGRGALSLPSPTLGSPWEAVYPFSRRNPLYKAETLCLLSNSPELPDSL